MALSIQRVFGDVWPLPLCLLPILLLCEWGGGEGRGWVFMQYFGWTWLVALSKAVKVFLIAHCRMHMFAGPTLEISVAYFTSLKGGMGIGWVCMQYWMDWAGWHFPSEGVWRRLASPSPSSHLHTARLWPRLFGGLHNQNSQAFSYLPVIFNERCMQDY